MSHATPSIARREAAVSLEHTLSALAAFSDGRGNRSNADHMRELAARFASRTFNLVVFGEFKRGKTTLINALVGDELLPAAVIPLTSAVTVLGYGPQEHIEVEFLDGRTHAIPRQALAEYVTEKGNPGNVKAVRLVRIAVPCDLLRNGMQLVGTPGVGSVHEHNTQTTHDFLPHVDGGILLVASDPPVSRGECEFLREMRPHVAHLFVVQNKTDQLGASDLEESLEFTRGVLSAVLRESQVRVFPLSAREALEARRSGDDLRLVRSGLPAFEEALRRFQADEQTDTHVLSVVRNALRVADDESVGLSIERQALRMTLNEAVERHDDFRRRREELLRQRQDDTTLVRASARRLIKQVLQRDYEEERSTRPPLLREMATAWAQAQCDASGSELLARGDAFIRETLFAVLGAWRRQEEARLQEQLAAGLARFTDHANETLSAIYAAAREVFELPPATVETVAYFTAPSRFFWRDWDWKPRPGLTASLLIRVLPGGRRRAIDIITSQLVEQHDMGCGRLRHDFSRRAQAAFDQYMGSIDQSLGEAIAGIDRAIGRAIAQRQRASDEVEEAETRVSRETAELESIAAQLREALPPGVEHAI